MKQSEFPGLPVRRALGVLSQNAWVHRMSWFPYLTGVIFYDYIYINSIIGYCNSSNDAYKIYRDVSTAYCLTQSGRYWVQNVLITFHHDLTHRRINVASSKTVLLRRKMHQTTPFLSDMKQTSFNFVLSKKFKDIKTSFIHRLYNLTSKHAEYKCL